MSHELKTPIAGIRGAVELLADECERMSDAQRQRFLANIDADAARMERLVDAAARARAHPERARRRAARSRCGRSCGGLVARYEDADLRLVVRRRAGRRSRSTPSTSSPPCATWSTTPCATAPGMPVESRVAGRGGRVQLAVRDRGARHQRRQPRARLRALLHHRARRGGTGLGLAIVQAVAEVRGGSLDFDSGPDGTEFRLVI